MWPCSDLFANNAFSVCAEKAALTKENITKMYIALHNIEIQSSLYLRVT